MKVLIVGQGIAGSLLALNLLENNIEVQVIDAGEIVTSSKVAAGIMIPFTGRRLVRANKAEIIIPYAIDCYRKYEQLMGNSFFYLKDILQLFSSNGNRNEWYNVSGDPLSSIFTGEILSKESIPDGIINNFGGIVLTHSGYLDTNRFLRAARSILEERKAFIKAKFNDKEIVMGSMINTTHGNYSHIIFCEGFNAVSNHLFNYLPFNPAKGEILDFHCEGLVSDYIINNGIFILPLGDGNFRAGSTYSWKDLNYSITEAAKNFLVEEISTTIRLPFTVTSQSAAIRPTTIDRRPFLGWHPSCSNIGILNGLGTKGVMLGPFYANQMAELIMGRGVPDADVDIKRFQAKFTNQA